MHSMKSRYPKSILRQQQNRAFLKQTEKLHLESNQTISSVPSKEPQTKINHGFKGHESKSLSEKGQSKRAASSQTMPSKTKTRKGQFKAGKGVE